MIAPPPGIVLLAERVAARSPCKKSRRGVVVFSPETFDRLYPPEYEPTEHDAAIHGVGFNGAPSWPVGTPTFGCDGSDKCRSLCRKRCAHAATRALRTVSEEAYRLHLAQVKIGDDGHVAPSGGPSCAACALAILDNGAVEVVWLYQEGGWCGYAASTFYSLSMRAEILW